MLAGRRLFEGARDGELVEKILFGAIDAPASVAPHVPEPLNAIVLRGLARDPADRFETARDLARVLREAVRPASASEVSDWVEAIAADTLSRAASAVAAIERSPGPPPPGGASRGARRPAFATGRARAAAVAPTTVEASAPSTAPAFERDGESRSAAPG